MSHHYNFMPAGPDAGSNAAGLRMSGPSSQTGPTRPPVRGRSGKQHASCNSMSKTEKHRSNMDKINRSSCKCTETYTFLFVSWHKTVARLPVHASHKYLNIYIYINYICMCVYCVHILQGIHIFSPRLSVSFPFPFPGTFAPWSSPCSVSSSPNWSGSENAELLRSGCHSSVPSNGHGSLPLARRRLSLKYNVIIVEVMNLLMLFYLFYLMSFIYVFRRAIYFCFFAAGFVFFGGVPGLYAFLLL